MASVEWQSQPPLDAHGQRVWWCPRGQKHYLRLLERPHWVEVHWRKGRSRPCLGEDCPAEWHECSPNWKGYAAALLLRRSAEGVAEWVRVILELTHGQGKQLLAARQEVVGLVVLIARDHKPKSPPSLELVSYEQALPPEPAWDIMPALYRLWGLSPAGAPRENRAKLRLHGGRGESA